MAARKHDRPWTALHRLAKMARRQGVSSISYSSKAGKLPKDKKDGADWMTDFNTAPPNLRKERMEQTGHLVSTSLLLA